MRAVMLPHLGSMAVFARIFVLSQLGVRDDQQGRGMFQDTLLHTVQRLGIKGGKTLVQDEDGGTLQQRAGDVEPTALAMRELPAGLADDLPQPGRACGRGAAQIQGAAQGLGRLQVRRLGWPAAAHEQVEGQGPGKEVIVVELWRGHHPPPPARGPEGWTNPDHRGGGARTPAAATR